MAKSSMQELIDWLDPSFSSVIEKAKELLEKEKQQIIDSYNSGAELPNAAFLDGEEYFTQTYNQ